MSCEEGSAVGRCHIKLMFIELPCNHKVLFENLFLETITPLPKSRTYEPNSNRDRSPAITEPPLFLWRLSEESVRN